MRISEEELEKSHDFFSKPFGEGSSSLSGVAAKSVESIFKLYFKGLVSEEMVGKEKAMLAGLAQAQRHPTGPKKNRVPKLLECHMQI
ncbi:hypothetical protein ACFX14_039787 [Malus domestica]